MNRLALLGVLLALTACGAAPSAAPPSQPKPRELAATPTPAPVTAAATSDARRTPAVVASPPAELFVRPPVGGTGALLFMSSTARVGGMTITFAKYSYKGDDGVFDFQLVKAGKKVDVRLRSDEEKFQAEVVAHGALFVFEQRAENMFTVMLVAATAPDRLADAACIDMIDDAATRGGIGDTGTSKYGSDDGVLRLRRKAWTAYCGRYTKRVWFGPAAERN